MRVVVTIEPAAHADINEVVRRVQAAGLEVDQILSVSGIITGSADAAALPALRGLTGVGAVEPDADLPLPDDRPR